VLTCCKT